jgi:hypothetical protein
MESHRLFSPATVARTLSPVNESGSDDELTIDTGVQYQLMRLPKMVVVYPHVTTFSDPQIYHGALVNHPQLSEFTNGVYADHNDQNSKTFIDGNYHSYHMYNAIVAGRRMDFLFVYRYKDMLPFKQTGYGDKAAVFYRVSVDNEQPPNCILTPCPDPLPKIPFLFFAGTVEQRSYMMAELIKSASKLARNRAETDEVETHSTKLTL